MAVMFRHGDRVRLKNCPPDREPLGKVVGRPREGSLFVNVKWPDGWAGFINVDDIEHERLMNPRAGRAEWAPTQKALRDADIAWASESSSRCTCAAIRQGFDPEPIPHGLHHVDCPVTNKYPELAFDNPE